MHASFRPCPHCDAPLSFLEGAAGSTKEPKCPRCREVVPVSRATFLMADHSRPKSPRGEDKFVGPVALPDQLITFEDVEVTQRSDLGCRCRVGARVVWVGSPQSQPGSEADIGGRRLVLRRADAAELGLIDWTPAA